FHSVHQLAQPRFVGSEKHHVVSEHQARKLALIDAWHLHTRLLEPLQDVIDEDIKEDWRHGAALSETPPQREGIGQGTSCPHCHAQVLVQGLNKVQSSAFPRTPMHHSFLMSAS